MSTFTPKALADGQLPNSSSAIFTASADVATYVKSFTVFNAGASQNQVVIRVNRTGTDRIWKRFILEAFESADLLGGGESLILEDGDIIKGFATNASQVDYLISGIEETA